MTNQRLSRCIFERYDKAPQKAAKRAPAIRAAVPSDIANLLDIEEQCFTEDRLSRRSFSYLVRRGHAALLVEDAPQGELAGYALVLFNQGTSLARLYSFATHPRWQRRGVAKRLLKAAEKAALDKGSVAMRLEVRPDNKPAIALYKAEDYRQFGIHPDYYEDHSAALRFEKSLVQGIAQRHDRVPYYPQSLEFTCGPAALMMAMKAIDPKTKLNRQLEIQIWREATSIFMTSGHGGCEPYGLALAAYHRGFDVEVQVTSREPMFLGTVRDEDRRAVIAMVHQEFTRQIKQTGITVKVEKFDIDAMIKAFDQGGIPLVLISHFRLTGEKSPHWIVMTGYADDFVFFHDPYVDWDLGKTETDSVRIPATRAEFVQMARYGISRGRAAVIIKQRNGALSQ